MIDPTIEERLKTVYKHVTKRKTKNYSQQPRLFFDLLKELAALANLKIVVVDSINPIDGIELDLNKLQKELESTKISKPTSEKTD